MSDKPNWAEKANLASNVLRNIQLQELHSTLRETGTVQAEKLQLELNEQQAKNREDRLREHIWQMEQNFERLLNNPEVIPCTLFILSKQTQGLLAQFGVTTASFRQFADKDRLGKFIQRLQQAAEDSQNKMSSSQKADTETYLRYQSEAQSLEEAVANQREAKRQRSDLRDKIKECRQQKAQSVEELEHLSQSLVIQKQAEAAERPRPIRRIIKIVLSGFVVLAGASAITLIFLSFVADDPVLGMSARKMFWLGAGMGLLMIISAAILAEMSPKRKSETIGEQIKVLEAKIKEKEAEISNLESQNWGEDRSVPSLSAFLKQKKEREAFMLQFRQVNDLPLEDTLRQQVTAVGRVSPHGLSLEVQQLARDPERKIAAIKLLREQKSGMSLTEAKAAIEAFMSSENN